MLNVLRKFAVIAALSFAGLVQAEVPEEYAFLEELFPGVEVTDVRPSPIDGMVEVYVGVQLFYLTEDKKYIIQGEAIDLTTMENVTEKSKSLARAEVLESFDESTTIVFKAPNEKYRISVFTDIDCGYCRKLHRNMAEYNARGITVQYLFFPRSGPNTDSWFKAEKVWCSDNRQESLTAAKANQPFEGKTCPNTPVMEHYTLGRDLGVNGTPALFKDDGELIIGYREPDELLALLKGE